jgi:hypothetical protein
MIDLLSFLWVSVLIIVKRLLRYIICKWHKKMRGKIEENQIIDNINDYIILYFGNK